jgi:hypothetical protein
MNLFKVIDYFIELGLELFRGQEIEIYYRDQFICPTESEYIEFIGGSTLQEHPFISMTLKLFFCRIYQYLNICCSTLATI